MGNLLNKFIKGVVGGGEELSRVELKKTLKVFVHQSEVQISVHRMQPTGSGIIE